MQVRYASGGTLSPPRRNWAVIATAVIFAIGLSAVAALPFVGTSSARAVVAEVTRAPENISLVFGGCRLDVRCIDPATGQIIEPVEPLIMADYSPIAVPKAYGPKVVARRERAAIMQAQADIAEHANDEPVVVARSPSIVAVTDQPKRRPSGFGSDLTIAWKGLADASKGFSGMEVIGRSTALR